MPNPLPPLRATWIPYARQSGRHLAIADAYVGRAVSDATAARGAADPVTATELRALADLGERLAADHWRIAAADGLTARQMRAAHLATISALATDKAGA